MLLVVVQLFSRVELSIPGFPILHHLPELAQTLKLMCIELVMPSNHLILCRPFSCLQSFLASASFPMSQFFTSGGQSFGVSTSASVLPMNILNILKIFWLRWTHHGYFPLFLLPYPCTSLHPNPCQHTHTHTHTHQRKRRILFLSYASQLSGASILFLTS